MIDVCVGRRRKKIFDVDSEEAREMVRGGEAVRRFREPNAEEAAAGSGKIEWLELMRPTQLPSWVFGSTYHLREEVAPGVKVPGLQPSGRRLQIPQPLRVIVPAREAVADWEPLAA